MNTHSISILKTSVCHLLQVNPQQALAQVAWSAETRAKAEFGVSADDYFAFCDVIMALAKPPVDVFSLGRSIANGAIAPIFLAFASAPNLEEGFRRMARYKTLFGPVLFKLSKSLGRLKLEIVSEYSHLQIPTCLATAMGVFTLEKSRIHAAKAITPYAVTVPEGTDLEQARDYFRIEVTTGPHFIIEFSAHDTHAHFVSENAELWQAIEQDLEQQLRERDNSQAFHLRVEAVIRRLLTLGPARAEHVCYHLGVSRSTLQRILKVEQKSYQAILDKIRLELAERYLSKTALQANQIASLVGFSDSKSFHRAFKTWTGHTPEQWRHHCVTTKCLKPLAVQC